MSVEPIKKSLLQQAKEEVNEELKKEAVKKLKRQLQIVEDAKLVLRNAQRELEDLEREIDEGLL